MGVAPPITTEQLQAIDDARHRFELVKGRLVVMEPGGFEHGAVAMRAGRILAAWLEERSLGICLGAESGFTVERSPDTVLAPDFAFVRADRVPHPFPRGFPELVPDLVMEVVSQNDTAAAVERKARGWIEAGVREVWVVDPERRTLTIHRPGAGSFRLGRDDEAVGGGPLQGFRCPVADLFPG